MTITIAIHHSTSYHYDRLVSLSAHQLRLKPAPHCRTPIKSYSLKVTPANHFINWQQDPFGNFLARLVFPEKTRTLQFDVELVCDLIPINPFDFFVEDYAKDYPFSYSERSAKELAPFFEKEPLGPHMQQWLETLPQGDKTTIDFLCEINQLLAKEIEYTIRLEAGVQSVETTLEKKRGSCRDSAWVLIQALRHKGIAARFASGYLVQLKSDQRSLDGPSGPAEDFTDLHAWAEAFVPGAGWIGLDPTSGLFAGEGHIPLACTPHYQSAAPIDGASDPAEVEFHYANKVTRIHEDPRITWPYTEAQWAGINALGEQVEQTLKAQDVRLTMGGEPTFISIDDFESAQWNHGALGNHKRERAEVLFQRLYQHYSPNGLRHYGQGKWYPGEPLPRWALSSYWRQDGEPIWQNPSLYADVHTTYNLTLQSAGDFIETLCQQLSLPKEFIQPAFEDTAYMLWQEGNLPPHFQPEGEDLTLAQKRAQLLAALDDDIGLAKGYVLPLHWNDIGCYWQSSQWEFNRRSLFLMPGDSPIGLRLPLERVGWSTKTAEASQTELPVDPFAPVQPLATTLAQARQQKSPSPLALESHTLTALCIEIREDKLCVFMPPINRLEPYLLLVSAIEATAKAIEIPVILEGYPPPPDLRLQKIAVTPDPGVIEVNIQPAKDWDELKQITNDIYNMARESRLDTVKYRVDGQQMGTGGGNHVTLGGHTPSDSPLLRKPSLLRSLITYWQHHPGLSYLFSGTFIGPTSQAPRIDEGRQEYLYELETAFKQLDALSTEPDACPPWLVDRCLRHLLVDITGNTHRAEFCIDKLYSPDSSTGRLGLLEFRGFEMPPHPQMSLAQMLLIRVCVARFWEKPYQRDLVRWGTDLHDRFLLPHFVWEDMKDVCADLNQAGFDYKLAWLKPFWAFRFPVLGRSQWGSIGMELRAAIEPWHVLGEEMSSSGTARFVDSSIERIQVKLTGLTSERYILSCNGARAPLTPTGVNGEYIAGIRFRAWAPPSCLHPTINVQSPLTFDLVDTWTGKAVGGCTYHVSHPGGRNFDTFPINALEAQGRMTTRFEPGGHSPGVIAPVLFPPANFGHYADAGHSTQEHFEIPEIITEPEFPYTLDLLRQTRQQP